MRLASSFGLGAGGGSTSSTATVQEYLTSRDNIAHAMTSELENGRLIDRYYQEAIEEDEEFAQEFTSKFGTNQRYTDSVLIQVALRLNEGVLGVYFDKKSDVLKFSVVAYNENFTYDLATLLVENTESQFRDWKKEKGSAAVAAFEKKVDSLEIAIDLTLRRLGEYQDQNNSLISAVDKMEQMRLTIDMESLRVAYGEYIKGLEMSKAELMNLEGPFKYFDEPIFPLQKDKGSAAKAGISGSVITGLLLVLFLIVRNEASNIMAD
jgi:capsule polysaccharide export protein KpsE/RkpR